MSRPLFPQKYGQKTLLSPEMVLGRLGQVKLPPTVILCYGRSAVKSWQQDNKDWREVKWPLGRLYQNPEIPVALMSDFGVGAPALIMKCEELASQGVENFIVLGWAGALDGTLQVGDVVVCETALRDEGTSVHYLPPEENVYADTELIKSLQSIFNAQGVCSWSTDAPYRETAAEVEFVGKQGAKVVDMEISALLAWAQAKEKSAAGVFVISDRVGEPPDFSSKLVKNKMSQSLQEVIAALSN